MVAPNVSERSCPTRNQQPRSNTLFRIHYRLESIIDLQFGNRFAVFRQSTHMFRILAVINNSGRFQRPTVRITLLQLTDDFFSLWQVLRFSRFPASDPNPLRGTYHE
jgi:hypothetical protein